MKKVRKNCFLKCVKKPKNNKFVQTKNELFKRKIRFGKTEIF